MVPLGDLVGPPIQDGGLVPKLTPESMRGYKPAWLSRDVIAGVTLAAVAIPETMGYTSIAQTPVVTGLYTVIFPTIVFALLGSSRLLVVGADSATAAILAAGLAGMGIAGLQPDSAEWVAWTAAVSWSSPDCSSSASSATS
jgi:MFS superfamily sulfate permease-like transporter